MKLTPGRSRRWIIVIVLLAVALPGGYYLARYQALPAYKHWRGAKLEKMARDFYAARDYDSALLTARQILRGNKRNAAMWKLARDSARAKDSAEAVYYQRELAKIEKTLPNQLELIRLALHYGLLRQALEGVTAVGADGRDSADFHQLAAETFLRIGKPTTAKIHLYSLVQLRPDDEAAQLELADVELTADANRTDPALRQRVEKLAEKPALRARALTLLVQDAVRAQDAKAAHAYAARLLESGELDAKQRVLALEGLQTGSLANGERYRGELEKAFAASPDDAAALVDYLVRTNQSKEAVRWAKTLPEKTATAPEVQQALANAYVALRQWDALNSMASAAQWGAQDYLRYAFLAYAGRATGRMADATNAWKLAVIRAGDNARYTAHLLSRITAWGWESEKYDLVWKLFALMPRNDAIARQLIVWERAQGRTSKLNQIFARLFELDPEDRVARNNFAYTSLLLDSNLAQAYALARENYWSEPHNPYYVTTQALALYKQGKQQDALELIESLRASQLSDPERVLCRALLHAASGDGLGARGLMVGLDVSGMLPEEQKLATQTRTLIARFERERGRDSQLYAIQSSGSVDLAQGWLQAVSTLSHDNATKDMQLADSLFAARDMKGLNELLRTSDWGPNDAVRLALLAYVARANGNENEARTQWRRALTLAGRDVGRLQPLAELATDWKWRAERLEAWDRLFDRMPNDPAILDELMAYHRAAGRTGDMVRVLDSYLSAHPAGAPQVAEFAYYSMLSGINVSRAYLNAKQAYEAAPSDLKRRLVYAFALWQQKRPEEAWKLVQNVDQKEDTLVPVPLLRAVILSDLNRPKDAKETLGDFGGEHVLPEEATMAMNLRRRLSDSARVSSL